MHIVNFISVLNVQSMKSRSNIHKWFKSNPGNIFDIQESEKKHGLLTDFSYLAYKM